MRVTSNIPINCINVDREPINAATYALAKFLESGGEISPIHVEAIGGGRFRICDGRHRVLAYKLLGYRTIPANYALPEDPKPDKELPVQGEGQLEADATPAPVDPTTYLEE